MLKPLALFYVGDSGAQQVTVRRVYAADPFTPHWSDFQSDHAVRQMEQQFQPIVAIAEPFVDDRGWYDHPQSGGAEVAGLTHEDKGIKRFAGVSVEQREVGLKLDFALHLEPAHSAAFDGRCEMIQPGQLADWEVLETFPDLINFYC